MSKTKVLIVINHFLPGFKYGGPIRSVQALNSKLGDVMDFSIITTDKDFGDEQPYSNITFNKWQHNSNGTVLYFQGSYFSFVKRLIHESKKVDVIYLNSFFNPRFSFFIVLLKYFGFLLNKIVVAPRGEFNSGALNIKPKKKKLFINISKFFRLYKDVVWHATTQSEYDMIRFLFGTSMHIRLAEGMSPQVPHRNLAINTKQLNVLKLVFLARVAKIKNLFFLLEVLNGIKISEGSIQLDIFGPLEDLDYWNECKQLMNQINEQNNNVVISYKGEIEYNKVKEILPNYDFYVLPTLGENFGQSIADALSVGIPVIISQNTPWRNLEEKGVGWDLPLELDSFSDVIYKCILMDNKYYSILSDNALTFAESFLNDSKLVEKYQNLFDQ